MLRNLCTLLTLLTLSAWLAVGLAVAAITLVAPVSVAGTPTAPVPAPCTEEDASSPGQSFPCLWNAHSAGNGRGTDVLYLTAPHPTESWDADTASDHPAP